MRVVYCVIIGNEGLVYVCDRQGDRIQVFDRMGNFKNSIWIKRGNSLPDDWGTTWWIGFSHDREQKYMYVDDGGDEQSRLTDGNVAQPSIWGRSFRRSDGESSNESNSGLLSRSAWVSVCGFAVNFACAPQEENAIPKARPQCRATLIRCS
jgi:hypothetical protein